MEYKSKGTALITLWIALGAVVIIGFWIFTLTIGGSAFNGYEQAGKCFVKSHSNVAEVSKFVFELSKVWEILFWIFLPLTPVGAFAVSGIIEKNKCRKYRTEQSDKMS